MSATTNTTCKNFINVDNLDVNKIIFNKYTDPNDKTALAGSFRPLYKYDDNYIGSLNIYIHDLFTLIRPGGIPMLHPLYAPTNNKRMTFKIILDDTQQACVKMEKALKDILDTTEKHKDQIFTNANGFNILSPINYTSEYHDETKNITYPVKKFLRIRLVCDNPSNENPTIITPIFIVQDGLCKKLENPTIDELLKFFKINCQFRLTFTLRYSVLKKRDAGKRLVYTVLTAKQLIVIPQIKQNNVNAFEMPLCEDLGVIYNTTQQKDEKELIEHVQQDECDESIDI